MSVIKMLQKNFVKMPFWTCECQTHVFRYIHEQEREQGERNEHSHCRPDPPDAGGWIHCR